MCIRDRHNNEKILWNTVTTEYNHPAFLENGEGDFKFRLKGSDEVVTLHRAYKLSLIHI